MKINCGQYQGRSKKYDKLGQDLPDIDTSDQSRIKFFGYFISKASKVYHDKNWVKVLSMILVRVPTTKTWDLWMRILFIQLQVCFFFLICTDDIAEKFGLTPEQFGENLRDNYQRHDVEQYPIEPLELAREKVCGWVVILPSREGHELIV